MGKIIACDFDGTLCENKFPSIGAPRHEIIDALLNEQRAGARLILWTCRTEAQVAEAVTWCADHGIIFDAINDNLPDIKRSFGCDPRKVFANEYWDDRNKLI